MKARELMTEHPTCCTPDTSLTEAAKMMVDCDCGAIPVVEDKQSRRPVGMITDRDITVRAVAAGKNPADCTVADCMTADPVTVSVDDDLEAVTRKLEEAKIRRILVVDASGGCVGIIAQADIAKHAPKKEVGEMVREISKDGAKNGVTAQR